MAVIGFIVLVALGLCLTAFAILLAWANLGHYNIGGVPNSGKRKAGTLVFIVAVVSYWYWLSTFINLSINI